MFGVDTPAVRPERTRRFLQWLLGKATIEQCIQCAPIRTLIAYQRIPSLYREGRTSKEILWRYLTLTKRSSAIPRRVL